MPPPILDLSLSLDTTSLRPAEATLAHLVAAVRAAAHGLESARAPISVVFAVDASTSMRGRRIDRVIESIPCLVNLLDPTDRVGVVAFSHEASEIMPLVPATPDNRRLCTARVQRIQNFRGTNIEAGLRCAAGLLPTREQHERQIILLLSDGEPNEGASSPDELGALVRSFRRGVSVSTLGYGSEYQEAAMLAIARAGSGMFHPILDPAACAFEFAQALGAQADMVADTIELSLALDPGATLTRFLGPVDAYRQNDGERVMIPDLLAEAVHLVVAEVSLTPPREPGLWRVGRGVLSFHAAGNILEAPRVEVELRVPVGFGPAAPDAKARSCVLRALADEARDKARLLVDRRLLGDAEAALRAMIRTIEAEPGFVPGGATPLAEALELLRDEADVLARGEIREHRAFRSESSVPFTGTPLMSTPVGGRSARMMEGVAGALPLAWLTVIVGPGANTAFALDEPRIYAGRGEGVQIKLQDASASFRHALFFAQSGRFFVRDLGSTNGTFLNGRRLTEPTALQAGDVIGLGAISLCYHQR